MEKVLALKRVSVKTALVAGLLAGVVIAVLNNLYNLFCGAVLGISAPNVIHVGSVTGSSVVPALLAGLFYYLLARFTRRPGLIFAVVVVVFAPCSPPCPTVHRPRRALRSSPCPCT
jgi:Na+/proline symporter